ncbi:hypothetical protein DB347_19555 [Opitutaceae bacterium EW11]|nr:hypothetical protein DB347_19555 [Opitutaceae bacterium EW11]
MRKRVRSGRRGTSVSHGILLTVDNAPLRRTAWARLQEVRRRLTKATADLHRHENEDTPAYVRWTYATCPAMISEVRELYARIQSLASLITRVEDYAFRTGRSPESVWQQYKGEPPELEEEDDDAFSIRPGGELDDEIEMLATEFDEEFGHKKERESDEPPDAARSRSVGTHVHRRSDLGSDSETGQSARDIYRRLVQQLHPDRGGEWTARRQALWHEVQQAWEARDADWLARLEAEHEIETDTLTVESALGRLYAAIREIEGARRDAERKLRQYRKTPAWRFTLRERKPADAVDLADQLRSDREHAQLHLKYLEQTLARWSRPVGQARAKRKADGFRSVLFELG